ncbi:MAG: hypothetical protein ACOC7L_01475, partial [Acidobacteriota bacterium]
YRTVRVPEPLSPREETALGQMIAGFLSYLRYTRTGDDDPEDPAPERGEEPDRGHGPAAGLTPPP